MSGKAVVLLCGRLADLDPGGLEITLVDDLCHRPEAAADAIRATAATRAVLGICEGEGCAAELRAACRRAGVAPFGVEVVALPRGSDAPRLLESRLAKVNALPVGEPGKPGLTDGGYSRRALLSLAPAVSVSPVAVIEQTACTGLARCGLCLPSCPHEAIVPERGMPQINGTRCEACGLCVPACPTGAMRLSGSSARQLEAELDVLLRAPVAGIVFVCSGADSVAPQPGWFQVDVPAMSIVTPGYLLQVLAAGAPAVRLATCDGDCCAQASETVAFCRSVLEALGENAGSRVLLGAEPVAAAAGPLPGARSAHLTLTEPRATVDAALALASRPVAVEDEGAPVGHLELSPERCTVCGACATACPTKALRLEEDERQASLDHDPTLCVPCGLCVRACPEDALVVRAGLDTERLRRGAVTLVRSEREVCARCGADLPPLPMRRRIRELLADTRPGLLEAPLDLCLGCASRPRLTVDSPSAATDALR